MLLQTEAIRSLIMLILNPSNRFYALEPRLSLIKCFTNTILCPASSSAVLSPFTEGESKAWGKEGIALRSRSDAGQHFLDVRLPFSSLVCPH